MSDDETAFIKARLEEVRANAHAAGAEGLQGQWYYRGDFDIADRDGLPVATTSASYLGQIRLRHIIRHDPASTLRWIAAIRDLLARIDEADAASDAVDNIQIDPWTARDLRRILAAVWSDHPDYQQEWKL